MTKQEKALVLQALTRMAVSLGQDPDVDRQKIYLEYLSDLAVADVRRGVDAVIKTWTFNTYPPVGAIREKAGGNKSQESEAEAQWYALRNWKKPLKDMPLEAHALSVVKAMGGRGDYWGSFGNWPSSEEAMRRKEFIGRWVEAQKTLKEMQQIELNITADEAQKILDSVQRGDVSRVPG